MADISTVQPRRLGDHGTRSDRGEFERYLRFSSIKIALFVVVVVVFLIVGEIRRRRSGHTGRFSPIAKSSIKWPGVWAWLTALVSSSDHLRYRKIRSLQHFYLPVPI